MDLICKVVEMIVFSGIDGKILILSLIFLLYVVYVQALEFVYITKKIYREERQANENQL